MGCVLCRELGPALDDYLFFGIELDGVAPLGVKISEETGLPAAEREVGDRSSDANVDADVARRGFVFEAARGGAVGGKERGGVAVFALADDADRLIESVSVHEAEHGTEDFSGRKFAGGGGAVDHGRTAKVAGFVARNFGTPAVAGDGGSVARAFGDEAFDADAAVGRAG